MKNEESENQKTEYVNPWAGVDMKVYNRTWWSLMSLMVLAPIQVIAIGIGLYHGFQSNDGTLLTYAIALSLLLTVVKAAFYERASDKFDIINKDTNLKMWDNVNANVMKRYNGTIIPYAYEPARVMPPDGANGFWDKMGRVFKSAAIPVVLIDEVGNHEHKRFDVAINTFEPQLTARKTPKKK